MGDKGEGGVKNLKKWVTAFIGLQKCKAIFFNIQESQQTIHNWKWRLIGGLCFYFNWSTARLLAILIVYISNEWNTVLLLMTIYIGKYVLIFLEFFKEYLILFLV